MIVATTKRHVALQKLPLLSKRRELAAHRVRRLPFPATGEEQREHQSK